MTAYKCDICGKLYGKYNVNGDKGTNMLVQAVWVANMPTFKTIREYDLCKECRESFNTWLDSRKGINECEDEE